MIIKTYCGTQLNLYTPTEEPGVEHITVQITDDDGRPRSDVTIISAYGEVEGLTLIPTMIVAHSRSFPQLVEHFEKALRWANVNGGVFDPKAFIESEYAALHQAPPIIPPIIPPTPPIPAPTDTARSQATARITAYANGRSIGLPSGATFAIPGVGYGCNFSGGEDADGLCIVIDSVRDTHLVRNGFFKAISGDNLPNRARLGAPLEDEQGTTFGSAQGAVQHFEHGRLEWRKDTGKVTPTLS